MPLPLIAGFIGRRLAKKAVGRKLASSAVRRRSRKVPKRRVRKPTRRKVRRQPRRTQAGVMMPPPVYQQPINPMYYQQQPIQMINGQYYQPITVPMQMQALVL
jgi:hypothetical protein